MSGNVFDVVVIGAGPGGYVAAIRSAQLGLKTAIVEKEHMGGICLNWGCIPTKAMLRSAEIFHLMHRANEFGLKAEKISFDLQAVIKRSRGISKQLNQGVTHLLKKNKVKAFIGEATILEKGKIFNAYLIIYKGKTKVISKKFHLPNNSIFDEHRYFKQSDFKDLAEIKGIKIGFPICEDIWFSDISNILKKRGADLLISPNGSPYERHKLKKRHNEVFKRCKENNIPIIYLNLVGGQDDQVFDGGSFVINNKSMLCIQSSDWKEEINLANIYIDNNDLINISNKNINSISQGLESKYNAMVLGLRDYVNKNKFKGVLLGLSGGIDSALAVAIAVDALGSNKVRGIRMPSKYSSDGSLKDAEESGKLLNIKINTINIEKINETYLGELKDLFMGLDKDTTEENIQSRIRGVILMAISNKFGEMLISTGNKSEISVGYTTIYGDMNGGFCALKDAYKTDVYNLSKWRNENYNDLFLGPHGMAIPLNSIHKEPSAELDFNQRDQDSLPDYKILDEILIKIIEEEAPLESIISMGYDSKLVHKIYRLLLLSEYKRRQSAPGVKLTARSFGKERRYPITNAFLNDV